MRPATLLKRRLLQRCFPVIFAKFLKVLTEACNFIKKETPIKVFSCYFCKIFEDTFFTEHLQWLLLNIFYTHGYQIVTQRRNQRNKLRLTLIISFN